MTELEQYYNKFNEEKRFASRHGQVEYRVSMEYIRYYLQCCMQQRSLKALKSVGLKSEEFSLKSTIRLLDIGAGTGRYSIPLAEEGYNVTAVELVKYNLGILKKKAKAAAAKRTMPDDQTLGNALKLTAMQGTALRLKKLESNSFDVTLLFGPMYHITAFADKVKALMEAKRVTKEGGVILVAYCMNEYAVLTYAFKEHHILDCAKNGQLTEDFHTIADEKALYDYVRLEDIDALNQATGLERIKIISPDGAANYMRQVLNQMTEEEFAHFVQYQLAVCERQDLIGAGAHTVDILRKGKS